MGKNKESLHMQKALEKEIDEAKIEKDGYVYEEIGECHLALGNKKEAKKYFNLAHEYLSKDQWLVANEPDRLKRLKEMGGGTPDTKDTPAPNKSK